MTLMLATAALSGKLVSLAAIPSTVSDVTVGSSSSAQIDLENDGDIWRRLVTGGDTDLGDWVTPKSAAGANYEARMTVNSGSVNFGTTGSWLSLGTTRSWGSASTAPLTSLTANVTLEIRLASSGSVLASSTFTLSSQYVV